MRDCEALWHTMQDSGFGITAREKKEAFLSSLDGRIHVVERRKRKNVL